MYVYFERCTNARSDCIILSLSWMSKASEETSDDVAWKYHRFNSYDEGWLATGNAKGIVSATFTTCHCMKLYDAPARTNYNLRGHRSEVILVKWNEPFQKLATCDKMGIIFVWIKYEGRWSIELINDRNTQVTDFSWSHDGRMALICYKDGFVLVGSVAGQRFWSSMLNLEGIITCGSWSPNDQQVLFGTSDGRIIVMDVHGAMLAQVSVYDEMEIIAMEWSCEKFRIDDSDSDDYMCSEKPSVLAVSYANGHIHIMKNFDDVGPRVLLTGLKGVKMEWSNDGELLAVAGVDKTSSQTDHVNVLQFYTTCGYLRYSVHLSHVQHPVTALTWGHRDKRLFVATGPQIHIAWVTKIIGSLQLLSRFAIHSFLKDPCSAHKLSLPRQLRGLMSSMNIPTLTGYIPDSQKLREFVSQPPPGNERLHCTMLRNDDEITLGCASYTLFLEYVGGLVPLLKGKRTSKIRPEFAIYDSKFPENILLDLTAGTLINSHTGAAIASSGCSSSSDISDSEIGDGCASPRMQRKRRRRKKSRDQEREQNSRIGDDLILGDCLATEKLVEVTSNIWGTKFKIHGIACFLPANLGRVNYKTSLLHLQPRQMTIFITELRDDLEPDKDPNFNPNVFSEDEDDISCSLQGSDSDQNGSPQHSGSVPIAPMSPVKQSQSSLSRNRLIQRPAPSFGSFYPLQQPAQGYMSGPPDDTIDDLTHQRDDISNEFPYVDLTANPQLLQFQQQRNSQDQAFMVDINQVPDRTKLVTNGTLPKMWPGRNKKVGDSNDSNSDSDVLEYMQINREHSSHDGRIPDGLPSQPNGIPGWGDNVDLKYIDEDNNDDSGQDKNKNGSLYPFSGVASRKHRSRSVGQLSNLEAAVFQDIPNVSLRDGQTCFMITQLKKKKSKPKLKLCGKSRSLDSGTCDIDRIIELGGTSCCFPEKSGSNNYISLEKVQNVIKWTSTDQNGTCDLQTMQSTKLIHSSRIECCDNFVDFSPPPSPSIPKSSPSTSPLHRVKGQDTSPSPVRRNILQSPFFHRKIRRTRQVESSDEEVTLSGDEITTCQNYKDLESFQKAHIRQKLKKARSRSEGSEHSPSLPRQREFVMQNKAPLWNEASQVYQLDFGGRVTQESAKNFQIEFKGKQVMQFGRIDGNAYTLDFQYPFTALQAFAVALANVTQRLK